MKPEIRGFADADALATALAASVAGTLDGALRRTGRAGLVVSGGRTPEPLFARLGMRRLDWSGVWVTLADERWVPADDPASNEALVRTAFLTGPAADARFVPLHTGDAAPEAGEAACARRLAAMPQPFDLVLLGMGEDGHTASLFPGSPDLRRALDDPGPCVAVRAPGPGPARMTLTLQTLLDTRRVAILATGEAKRAVLDAALGPGPVEEMPIRAVLRQDRVPVEIFWAP